MHTLLNSPIEGEKNSLQKRLLLAMASSVDGKRLLMSLGKSLIGNTILLTLIVIYDNKTPS